MTSSSMSWPQRWSRVRSASLLGILLIVAPQVAAAATPRMVAPAGGKTLIAGQLVEIRWEGLPADVDEMELLLDVVENAAQRLRLTPQLASSTRSYLWRVPNLPGKNARLRLRWGRNGIETEGRPSAPFAIVADPLTPFNGLVLRRGEWWIADPLAASELPGSGVLPTLDERIDHLQPAATPEVNEVFPVDRPNRQQRVIDHEPRPTPPEPADSGVASRCPLTIPLRP